MPEQHRDLLNNGDGYERSFCSALPRGSATLVGDLDALISTSIICRIGVLLSLSVLILDRYIPGDWF